MFKLNSQQQAFKEAYLNPESPTFGNKTQSAILAGYSPDYADSIGCKGNKWMEEIVGDLKRLEKAEKVLDKTLEYNVERNGKIDNQLLAIQNKTAIFIAETAGKEKYSKRTELTGKDGATLGNSLAELPPEDLAKMRAIYEEAMKKRLTKSE